MNPTRNAVSLAVAMAVSLAVAWVAFRLAQRSEAPAPVAARVAPPVAEAAPASPAPPPVPAPVVPSAPAVRAAPAAVTPLALPRADDVHVAASPGPVEPPVAPPPPEAAVSEAALRPAAATGAIRGHLLDVSGRPIAGVGVVAVAADGEDAAEDVTDAQGRYLLLALRPGRYAVFAGLGTSIAHRVGGRGADVAPGDVTPVALEERHAGATVRVRAVDASGRPTPAQALLVPAGLPDSPTAPGFGAVLGSEAILLPGASPTVVEAVPPGHYTVVLLSGARAVGAPAQVDVTAGDLDVTVRVDPAAVSAL